ncbi:MAG: PolC-type DNA polymerase III [Myxococcota bacterium]
MSMNWYLCRIVAFDTETTGLRAFAGDRVIEFGAMEFFIDEQYEITKAVPHQYMINPGIPIPHEASSVSGIKDEDVKSAPSFGGVASKIHRLLKDSILVAHNFAFDLGFLRNEFLRCGMSWPTTYAEIDTLPLATRKLKHLRSRRLEVVAADLGIPLENAHRAFHDADATGRVFLEIAKRHGAPASLEGLVEWGVAVSQPPNTGHIAYKDKSGPEFIFGPHEGQLVEHHPDYLQWMIFAKAHVNGEWEFRFPSPIREWAHQFLRSRMGGRENPSNRSGARDAWNLDPVPWRIQQNDDNYGGVGS